MKLNKYSAVDVVKIEGGGFFVKGAYYAHRLTMRDGAVVHCQDVTEGVRRLNDAVKLYHGISV